jgi:hypothetical protein
MTEVNICIERAKLRKGTSHPLKSSFFLSALQGCGITLSTHLIHGGSGIFFDAFFYPLRPNVPYERLYVRAGAVPSIRKQFARQYLEGMVVPQFIAWVQGIVSLPPNSPVRREQQCFWRDLPPDPIPSS